MWWVFAEWPRNKIYNSFIIEIGIASNDEFVLISPFTKDTWRDLNLCEKLVNRIDKEYYLPI